MTTKAKQGKTGPKRSVAQRERDLAQIAELYEQRMSYRQILAAMNEGRENPISMGTLATDIEAVRDAWRKTYTATFNDHLARELASLDRIEREAWQAFDRSKKPKQEKASGMEEETPASVADGKDGADRPDPTPKRKKSSSMKQTDRDGDSKWLAIALDCVEKRARIIGLFAPERHELFTPDADEEDSTPLDRIEAILVKDLVRKKRTGKPLLLLDRGGRNRSN